MRKMAFEKVVLLQAKEERNKKMGGVLSILPLKLMEKHAITNKKVSLKIFPEQREIFLKKYGVHIILTKTR